MNLYYLNSKVIFRKKYYFLNCKKSENANSFEFTAEIMIRDAKTAG